MPRVAKGNSKPKKEDKKPKKKVPLKSAPKKADSRDRQMASFRRAAGLLKQGSDPTRLQVLVMLNKGKKIHVGAICEALDMSQPAVSHHLALLRHGKLIEPTRNGKQNFYGLTKDGQFLTDAARLLIA